ncbi:DEAD/DEAH box helicase [Desulfitobacterium sp.]|uniref:DEAD/DEAH box helicase n=1 Tax=Desulfitobacterium sp. TaxID=49981 RepID=UPI002C645C1B|nr:DEAD/DEAH box helicase [Desulfitobacterium sp.]HVJ48513.1 DEAD/DEAH box helicase [Desulfitobacterium sp.]
MLRLEMTDRQIRNLASYPMAYQLGVAYYQAGKVGPLEYNAAERKVKAFVAGTSRYLIQLQLTPEGGLSSYHCSCPAYSQHSGACKHIIAVLKSTQVTLPLIFQKKANSSSSREFLSFFKDHAQDTFMEELNLEVELELYVVPRHRVSAQFSLKVGFQRLYVVKDVGLFLNSLYKGKTLEFGKQFTFEPHRQTFNDQDRPIIDLLLEMYEQNMAWTEMLNTYAGSVFNSKKLIPLKGVYFRKFLDALGDKPFNLYQESAPLLQTQIIRQALPLELTLNSEAENLALTLDVEELPLQLLPDASYFLYQQKIYQATPAQQEILPSMLKAIHQEYSSTLILPSDSKEFFISEALPSLEKMGKVSIAPGLAEKFSRENLVTQIYFERGNDDGIAARVEFHYGENSINPFAPVGGTHTFKDSHDVILIRAVEEERKVLTLLELAEFSVNQGKIHLEDDHKIFEFATTYLPQLQELSEIFYSDDFKLTIHNSVSFAGAVRLDEKLDLLEISFQYSNIDETELADIFQALNLKKKYYRLKDGSFLNLHQPELETVARLVDYLDLKAEDLEQTVLRLPKYRALYIDNYLRQANLPGIQRNKAFKQLVQSILEPHDGDFEIPPSLQNVLRDYQKTGFQWLKTLAAYGLGGILADDMGLGKTLQVLAFILSEKPTASQPALVVAPTSVIYNWQEEALKFAPELNVLVVDGPPQVRQDLLADLDGWDLVVTSYPLLRRDTETYAHLEFSYCFLDEAQHIKNPQTINARSVQQLQAKGYFALTGTPIENSLSELWSIFQFIMPGYLLSHPDFRKKFEIPIVKGDDSEPLIELSRHVTPFILRRLKKDVLLELPDKIETRMSAQMTEEQTKIYLAFLQEAQKNIAREIASVGFERSQIKILAALTRLRQICCHPAMFVENYTGGSGKMQLFEEVIANALDSSHRILVFSQFTTMLDIIQKHLISKKIEHFYLRGSTKSTDRMKMVQLFNNGVGQIFLISLKAGGTGLNLTGADMVIHFDPWWNPAVEDQATDRAHRIGQKNAVQVIKLVTQGTIEEKVLVLQEKKKALIQAVIQPGETMISKLTEKELVELFDLDEKGSSLPIEL